MGVDSLPRTIELLRDGRGTIARIVDQKALPKDLVFLDIATYERMIGAIKDLTLRGAPAIGVAGAAALSLYADNQTAADSPKALLEELEAIAPVVASARPTAVNLGWGVNEALAAARRAAEGGRALAAVKEVLFETVKRLEAEDEAANREIGRQGATLFARKCRILTHCNAGSLATVFYGTALGIVYEAYSQGLVDQVYIDETRPVGQGARLTTWELSRAGVPATLICDNMAASLMGQGLVDAVCVGADRICRNGDAANKIGTYGLAVLARCHGIPFYVAAPSSSCDFTLETGKDIVIEQRDATEVADFVPPGIAVYNPAFDVTPASLITKIITERGIFLPDELGAAYLIN